VTNSRYPKRITVNIVVVETTKTFLDETEEEVFAVLTDESRDISSKEQIIG